MWWEGLEVVFFTPNLLREAGEIWILGCPRHFSCSGVQKGGSGREVFGLGLIYSPVAANNTLITTNTNKPTSYSKK